MRASKTWGSCRGILKLGNKVINTVLALRVVSTVPMDACGYSLNLESNKAILETIGSPFLPWKVMACSTAPKCK